MHWERGIYKMPKKTVDQTMLNAASPKSDKTKAFTSPRSLLTHTIVPFDHVYSLHVFVYLAYASHPVHYLRR